MNQVILSGSFDDLRLSHLRMLEETSRLGSVHVLLWSDETIKRHQGESPKYPEAERLYLLESLRFVEQVTVCQELPNLEVLPSQGAASSAAWIVDHVNGTSDKREFFRSHGVDYRILTANGFTKPTVKPPRRPTPSSTRKRAIVTGCYDWFHSGHVRFFEEVSELGDLYVVVGHDANIRFLKGEGHPLFSEQERCYMVQAVRFVKQAMISSGHGWLDAEPEIERLAPHIYAVNEDGDRPEKRSYCESHGIEYRVLKRLPKPGLPRRQSTNLRGF